MVWSHGSSPLVQNRILVKSFFPRPLPLTTITAWELLFEHFAIKQQGPDSKEKSDEVILVVGTAWLFS